MPLLPRDGKDVYSTSFRAFLKIFASLGRLFRLVEIDDQVEACRRIFASETRWTLVRGSSLEDGESEGLPVWNQHLGDPTWPATSPRETVIDPPRPWHPRT